ncbi:MAG: hypothetical protein ABI887_21445 [Burkholderiales bacterium]
MSKIKGSIDRLAYIERPEAAAECDNAQTAGSCRRILEAKLCMEAS